MDALRWIFDNLVANYQYPPQRVGVSMGADGSAVETGAGVRFGAWGQIAPNDSANEKSWP